MEVEAAIEELVPFLTPLTRSDLRSVAAEQLLGLSASPEGKDLIKENAKCLKGLLKLVDDPVTPIRKAALQSIVNITVDEDLCCKLLSDDEFTEYQLPALLQLVVDNSDVAETSCMVLSNLTRLTLGCQKSWQIIEQGKPSDLKTLVLLLLKDNLAFDHLALVLCNLSQHDAVRRQLVDKESKLIKELLPLTTYPKSTMRRKGIVGVIRNCSFDTENHEWLLSDEIDILPSLALPLAGPEELEDDVIDKLPLELQYLGEDKTRETDPEIRKMLIEAIHQLCATKFGRTYIKDKQIYYIMREFHKWEKVPEVVVACENLVDIFIGDDPEPGMENLKDVEIPLDLQEKFKKMDADAVS